LSLLARLEPDQMVDLPYDWYVEVSHCAVSFVQCERTVFKYVYLTFLTRTLHHQLIKLKFTSVHLCRLKQQRYDTKNSHDVLLDLFVGQKKPTVLRVG
jgi:hypothetical protein